MRTCKFHGEESICFCGTYYCNGNTETRCDNRIAANCGQFVPLAAEPPAPDSRPVDLAALLRYHRRETVSSRTDRAWHAEAAEALEGAVEELRLLRAIHETAIDPSSGPPYWADVLDAYRAWKEGR